MSNINGGFMKKAVILLFTWFLISTTAFAQSEIQLNSKEKIKLDTFFSNFSEAGVKSFTSKNISDELLLNFALTHNYKNNNKSLKRSKDNLSLIIPSALVDKTTEKFFGKKMLVHRSKNYIVSMADGEAYTFSQIRRLTKISDDTYEASGTIFTADSGFTGDPHGTPARWKKSGEDVDCAADFVALIKKSSSDKDRFILLKYDVSAKKQR
jgi:hypothetical protein